MNEQKIPQGFKAPEKYALRAVKPTAVTPVIDGKITAEEWGTTPDFRLDLAFTGGKRTYCQDHFYGAGKLMAEMDCFWRYDDEYVYLALRVREPEKYDEDVPLTIVSMQRTMLLSFGKTYFRLLLGEDRVDSVAGNMCYAYEKDGDFHCYEFAASRASVTEGGKAFLGYVEHKVTINYVDDADPNHPIGMATVTTRTTPMYTDASFSHDVFVLEEGKPAPVPAEKLPVNVAYNPHLEDVKVKDGLTLRFSDPIVLEQGEVGDQTWGHYQFTSIRRMSDGSIRAGWSYSNDTIEYKKVAVPKGCTHSVSRDEGKTWEYGGAVSPCAQKNRMKNGKYFAGFAKKGAYKTDYLDKYTPGLTWNGYKMFFAEDIAETADKTVTAYEYDPETGEKTAFTCTVHWPYMPLVQFPGELVYPTTTILALSGGGIMIVDGVMYLPAYFNSFDAFAESREDAVKPWCTAYSLLFFKSEDCGRTWDLISQIPATGTVKDFAEGPCEAEMNIAPDGSFVMMFRTGGCNPCYITRSTDRGETWSAPQRFDDIGVFPQILTLKCGVTLATYGRPTMRFAATDDPAAMSWEKPFDFPVSGGVGQSCFYNDLFPIADNQALFSYTDFMYPNKDGLPARAVLLRTVTVIRD